MLTIKNNNESADWFTVGGMNRVGGWGHVYEHSRTACEYLHKYLHHKIRPGKQHWKDANTRAHTDKHQTKQTKHINISACSHASNTNPISSQG